jgi:hypothetical protein
MFELHVVVAGIVMFNIIELIMEIVPNYPTETSCPCSNQTKKTEQKDKLVGILAASSKQCITDKQNV